MGAETLELVTGARQGTEGPRLFCLRLVRLHQFDVRNAQSLSQLIERYDRGVPTPSFEVAYVLLAKTRLLGELLLGHFNPFAHSANIPAN